jgi:dipeptidyl aminopeptidase/acylaminoacyl peptidase
VAAPSIRRVLSIHCRRVGRVVLAALATGACGLPTRVPLPPPTAARPSAATVVDAAGTVELTPTAAGSSSATYSGHGAETVPPALIEKYRPRPLPPEVGRRIESLIDVRAPGIGRLSPDGKALFFSWTITGVPQVWRIDGPRRFPQQLTGGEDSTSVAAITPDGRMLVVQRDRKGEENPGLYLQPVSGGPLERIAHVPGVQTQFEAVSSDSRFVYFTSNDRKPDAYIVYRYDLASHKKEVAFDREDGLWHVSDLRDDGRLLLRKETGSLTAEYYEWDPRKVTLTPVLGVGEKEEYDARYGAREGELIVLTNKLGEYRRLYDWSAGKLTPIGDDVRFDVLEFDVDRRRTRVVYTTNEGGYSRPHAIDAKTLQALALPSMPAHVDHVTFGPTTPDARFTTVGIDDGRRPTQGYVLDWTAGSLTPWHQPSTPEVDTTRFARAELEAYVARDGTKIPVFVRQPSACQAGPCPVIVGFHGGPEGQARPGFSVGAQMFVDAGFVYVEPNVRGSDGYGKTWLHADDGPKRLDIITDIEDAATWARSRFAAGGKAPKVGIYGGSYGGYSVLMGMTRFAGAYDAGVDVVGISDLRTFLRNTAPYRRILRISEYGDPDRDADALAKLSPMTYVDRVKAPLLIVQGASDPRVPAGEAIQIHDALERKNVPCDLVIFPDEGHGAQKRENRVLTMGHAIEFFRAHLDAK